RGGRMPVHEEAVRRVYDPVAGDVDDDVAPGVRRADLDQADRLPSHVQLQLTLEDLGGEDEAVDALEVEAAEDPLQVLAGPAEPAAPRLPHLHDPLRSGVDHLLGGSARRVDAGALDEAVPARGGAF